MQLNGNGKDEFLDDLEKAVREIIRNKKSSKSEKLAAITAGVKVAQMRHRVNSDGEEKGFFSK